VSDPANGRDVLSIPQIMSNLLQDLLPDAPRETGLLVAAASAGLPAALRDHVSHGMAIETAIGLTASSLAARTAFTQDACAWVATELAIALDLASADLPTTMPQFEEAATAQAEAARADDSRASTVQADVLVTTSPDTEVAVDIERPTRADQADQTAPTAARETAAGRAPGRRLGPATLVGTSILIAGAVVAAGGW